MYEDAEETRQISYWPSVSDLFMTLFILALVLLATLFYVFLPTSTDRYQSVVEAMGGIELPSISQPTNRMRNALGTLPPLRRHAPAAVVIEGLHTTADEVVRQLSAGRDIEDLRKSLAALQKRLDDLEKQKEALEKTNQGLAQHVQDLAQELSDKPPIIQIAATGPDGKQEYNFPKGKALVSTEFQSALATGAFPKLADEILLRNAKGRRVDTLEFIGHTDGLRIAHDSNLDLYLPKYLAGDRSVLNLLAPGSNNDLGLLRACAIKEEWLTFIAAHPHRAQLEAIDLRCYSAGQTVPEGLDFSTPGHKEEALFRADNDRSRRIEIRLTKLR